MAGIYPLEFNDAAPHDTSSPCTETSASSTEETSESPAEEEEPLPVPPPGIVGSAESHELLKYSPTHLDDIAVSLDDVMCCKSHDKHAGQTVSLIGWDLRSFKSRPNLPKRKNLRKVAKAVHRQCQAPTKDGFMFRHYHDTRAYMEQYRRVHTCGGVGRAEAGEAYPRVLGVDTEDPYMARLRNVGFWFDRYELIESLAKTGTYSRQAPRPKESTTKVHASPIRSPREDKASCSPPDSQPGSTSPSTYVKLTMSRFGPTLGTPVRVPGEEAETKSDHVPSPRPQFRGYKDFKALTNNDNKDRGAAPVSASLEVTTLLQRNDSKRVSSPHNTRFAKSLSVTKSNDNNFSSEPSSQAQTKPSVSTVLYKSFESFSRLAPPQIPKCIGKGSDAVPASHVMRNRKQTSKLDAGDNTVLTRSYNGGGSPHKPHHEVRVCDMYSTSSGGSTFAPRGASRHSSLHSSSTMSNPFQRSTRGHKYKHHCARKFNMSQPCQTQSVAVAASKS